MSNNMMKQAGFWRRFLAFFLDAFVIGFLALPIFFALTAGVFFYVISVGGGGFANYTTAGATEIIASLVINLVITMFYIGYFAGMESSVRQATYGKMMLGIKVVDEDGYNISFWRGVGRYFAKFLSLIPLGIGFLMAGFTEKKQALHDKIVKTLVISEGGCLFWPTIKALLISILLVILIIGGSVYYAYMKYGEIVGDKSWAEFISGLMSSATINVDVEIDPLSKTSNYLEVRDDGLFYEPNQNVPFTGTFTPHHENGQKAQEGTVIAGYPDGPYKIWYENGQLQSKGNYKKGKLEGVVTFWDEAGNFLETQKFENGVLVDKSTTPPDTLSDESDDNLTTELENFEDTNLQEDSADKEIKETFYENGQKKTEKSYINEELNGTSTLWYENGQKKVVINYKDGQRHGLLTRWDENGNTERTLTYSNGKIVKQGSSQIDKKETSSAESSNVVTAQKPPNIPVKGIHATAGPVLLELGTFFTDLFWIKAALSANQDPAVISPNEFTIAEIKIKNVLNLQNVNLYDPGHNLEGDFFRKPSFERTNKGDIDYYGAIRQVNVNKGSGLKESEISSINGTVILTAPINVKKITFTSEDINQEKSAVGNTIKLIKIEQKGENFSVDVEFSNKNTLLKIKAYHADEEEISWASTQFLKSSWSMSFRRMPSKIDVFVCEKLNVNEYPFSLKK